MSILVFDIETVPDTASGRQLYSMSGLNDNDVFPKASTKLSKLVYTSSFTKNCRYFCFVAKKWSN